MLKVILKAAPVVGISILTGLFELFQGERQKKELKQEILEELKAEQNIPEETEEAE